MAVLAALVAKIPVAHIHGGELTVGAFDDALRHSITKMSHLHFVAAEEYKDRVIQLGEDPERVFLVGGMGVDNIKAFAVQLPTLDDVSISFLSNLYKIDKSEFKCYKNRRSKIGFFMK